MKAKPTSLVLSALMAALFSGSALAVTQVEAHAQLDQTVATDSRAAAHEVLDTLVTSGVAVDNALAVVTDAVNQNVDAGQLRQMGSEIRARVAQNVTVEQAYAQVKSEFIGAASASNRAATVEGNQAVRAGGSMGSAQASTNLQAQAGLHGVNAGNGGRVPGTPTPAAAMNPVAGMNPVMVGAPAMVAHPGAPGAAANLGATGNAHVGINLR